MTKPQLKRLLPKTTDSVIDPLLLERNIFVANEKDLKFYDESTKSIPKVQATLKDMTKNMDLFTVFVDKLLNSFGDTIVDLLDVISEYMILGFQVYYGVLIGIGGLSMIISTIYAWGKVFCLKYVLHVLWNFIMFFTFVSFSFGGLLGLIGSLGSEVIAIANYVFNDTYISEEDNVFGNKDTGNYLNICINGNGDLGKTIMNGDKTQTKFLDDLYKNSIDIEKNIKQLQKLFFLSAAIHNILEERNNIDQLELQTTDLDFFQSINSHTKFLLSKHKKIYYSMTKVTDANLMTQDLRSTLNPLLGDNDSFISLFDCKFMKTDIIMFLDIFGNQFADASIYIGITLMCSACSSFIGVFFFISMIYDFDQQARKNDESDIDNEDDNGSVQDENGVEQDITNDKKNKDKDSAIMSNRPMNNNNNKPSEVVTYSSKTKKTKSKTKKTRVCSISSD